MPQVGAGSPYGTRYGAPLSRTPNDAAERARIRSLGQPDVPGDVTMEGPNDYMDPKEQQVLFPKGLPSDAHQGGLARLASQSRAMDIQPQYKPQTQPSEGPAQAIQQGRGTGHAPQLEMTGNPDAVAGLDHAARQAGAWKSIGHSVGKIIAMIAGGYAGGAAGGGGGSAGGMSAEGTNGAPMSMEGTDLGGGYSSTGGGGPAETSGGGGGGGGLGSMMSKYMNKSSTGGDTAGSGGFDWQSMMDQYNKYSKYMPKSSSSGGSSGAPNDGSGGPGVGGSAADAVGGDQGITNQIYEKGTVEDQMQTLNLGGANSRKAALYRMAYMPSGPGMVDASGTPYWDTY